MVAHNGPLYINGDLEISGSPTDMEGVRFRAALCRCGASKNKPFCDGSHSKDGLVDTGAVSAKGSSEVEEGGKLQIDKAPNGPLILSGNFAILAGSGRLAWQGNRAALCRCGKSKNKPFCDGAHVKAGFVGE